MGFLKKLQNTAEKGVELGTKGYERTKDTAKKGHDKAKRD